MLNKGTEASSKKNSTKSQVAFHGWLQEPLKGTISLQHDIDNNTVAEIPITLDLLTNSGYSPVLISKCANLLPFDETDIKGGTSVSGHKSTGGNNDQYVTSGEFIVQIPVILSITLIILNNILGP